MVCALLLAACWFVSLRYGVGFSDDCDEIADPQTNALLLAPLI